MRIANEYPPGKRNERTRYGLGCLEIRPEAEEPFGLFLAAPLTREQAFNSIRQDLLTHAWVLDYYFSKQIQQNASRSSREFITRSRIFTVVAALSSSSRS